MDGGSPLRTRVVRRTAPLWPDPTSRPQAPLVAVASRPRRGSRRRRPGSASAATTMGAHPVVAHPYRAARPGGRLRSAQCGRCGAAQTKGRCGPPGRGCGDMWSGCGRWSSRCAARATAASRRRRRLPVPEGTRRLPASSSRIGERRCELRLGVQLI